MDYRTYEAEDFMMDDSFRNYCLGNNEKDSHFWEEWIRNNPDKAAVTSEARNICLLLAGDHSAQKFIADKNNFEIALQQHFAQDTVRIPTLSEPNISIRSVRLKKMAIYAAVAAAVLVALFWYYPFQDTARPKEQAVLQYNFTETSKPGERKSFQLPDGSKVMLNAGSDIRISKEFNDATREITLSGEAFFDVVHNPQKPFIIHTDHMDVKVLGTVFNVKAYPSDKMSETSLLKGSVEITLRSDSTKKVLLKPNQKVILPNAISKRKQEEDTKEKLKNDNPDFKISGLTYDKTDSTLAEVSWTENRLVFTDTRFEEIATDLERWYNISIAFTDEKVKQYRFTAVFDQKNIMQVLDALQLSRRFEYTIEANNKIIISR